MKAIIKHLMVTLCVFSFFGLLTSAAYATQTSIEAAMSLQKAFVEVARQLKPSVVNIQVERSSSGGIRWSAPGDEESGSAEEFFRKFFGGPGLRFRQPESFKTQAAGSGLIIGEDGMILTNNHVIKDASKIVVKFHDGKELNAEIVGQDPQTDLAVIKVEDAKGIKAARFADSDAVEAGQWCIAVGNPLGLEQTVTVGVVSAVGRSGIGATAIEDFIQTDASINPGNSGGPLVDLHGRVIGINTLIFNAPGSGIGFAIPANMASRISSQIVKGGKVERPYIGITMQPLTDELAEHFGLKDKAGAVVMQLVKDGPAEKAGLKAMDIIRKIDGKLMKNTGDVQKYVLSQEVGKEIVLDIYRNGKSEQSRITLEQMPGSYGLSPAEAAVSKGPDGASGRAEKLGITMRQFSGESGTGKSNQDMEKLVIASVKPESPADKAGLRRGDLINQINGREIVNLDDVEDALKASGKKDSSVFLVDRNGIPMFVVVAHK